MSCNCKGKKSCDGLTPAILQIKKQSCCVYFHAVIIPESLGDDTGPYAPKDGKYRNTIVKYEANGHVYIYSSDGIPISLNDLDYKIDIKSHIKAGDNVTITFSDDDEVATISVVPDTAMSGTSTAPVENRAIKTYVDDADTVLQGNIDTEKTNRENADTALSNRIQTNSSDITSLGGRVQTIEGVLPTKADQSSVNAINNAINKTMVENIELNSTPSTTTVTLDNTRTNILSGATTTTTISMPVASSTSAGVMNSATYDAVQGNTNAITAIQQEAVVTSGTITTSSSQADILAAWQTASGLTSPINGASVWDSVNHVKYVYFTNSSSWVLTQEGLGGTVTVSQWTNSSAGIAKGSTTTGQIFAESDGTGSVNGWDSLVGRVGDAESDITSLGTSKQNVLTAGANINIDALTDTISAVDTTYTAGTGINIDANNVISNTQTSAEWGNITGTLSDQTDLQTALNGKVNTTDPVAYVGAELSTGGSSLIQTTDIANSAITTPKLADGSVTAQKIDSATIITSPAGKVTAVTGVIQSSHLDVILDKMVFLNVSIELSTAYQAGTNYSLLTVSSEYRPSSNIILMGFCDDGTRGNLGEVGAYLDSASGTIYAKTSKNNTRINLSGFWIAS